MFWLTEAVCADDFPYTLTGEASSGRVPAQRVSFSSYPAVLNSGDDFCKTVDTFSISSHLLAISLTRKASSPLQHVYTTVHDYRIEVRPLFLHCPFPLLASSAFRWRDW